MTDAMQVAVRDTALKAYDEKLMAGTSGNVSCYDHATGVMAVTPSNVDYRTMEPADVVCMRLDGTVVTDNGLRPSSEWRMHAEIYRARDDVAAIVHTHSPRATAFAVVREPIPIVLVEMLPFLGGDVPLAAFALPGTEEVGTAAAAALERRNACLLENHGVVAIGQDLPQAYIRAVYVEDAATICHFARQLGEPVLVPADAVEALRARYNLKP